MKFPPIIKSFPHFLHGGDYNPDQWLGHPEVIDEDFRLIKLAGCNTFSVGIFSWSSPQEPIWKSANFAGSSQIEKTPFPARFEKSCTPFAPSSKTSSILNSPTILADLIFLSGYIQPFLRVRKVTSLCSLFKYCGWGLICLDGYLSHSDAFGFNPSETTLCAISLKNAASSSVMCWGLNFIFFTSSLKKNSNQTQPARYFPALFA